MCFVSNTNISLTTNVRIAVLSECSFGRRVAYKTGERLTGYSYYQWWLIETIHSIFLAFILHQKLVSFSLELFIIIQIETMSVGWLMVIALVNCQQFIFMSHLEPMPNLRVGELVANYNPENSLRNPEELGNYVEGDMVMRSERGRTALTSPTARWPDGIVPFEINGNFRNMCTGALVHWF